MVVHDYYNGLGGHLLALNSRPLPKYNQVRILQMLHAFNTCSSNLCGQGSLSLLFAKRKGFAVISRLLLVPMLGYKHVLPRAEFGYM